MEAARQVPARVLIRAVMLFTRFLLPAFLSAFVSPGTSTAPPQPIVYTLCAPAPATQILDIEARIPTDGKASIELMLPVWSPGYYVVQDYAKNVQDLVARTSDGRTLGMTTPLKNRWRVATGGAPSITLTYRLPCRTRFVTGCWLDANSAVINGPSTYITLAEQTKRPHQLRLERAPGGKQSITSLDAWPGGGADAYVAPDYDTFADSASPTK